jgi:hypothetical protein
MALLVMDEEEDSKKHFNYDKIVEHQNLSKKKKKQLMKKKELVEDDFEVTGSTVIIASSFSINLLIYSLYILVLPSHSPSPMPSPLFSERVEAYTGYP